MVVQTAREQEDVFGPAFANKDEVAAGVTRDWQ